MHTLSLQPPDHNWYMDTGATSRMTADGGNLTSYCNLSKNHAIIVGNGSKIPIHGYGCTTLDHSHPPFKFNNVLHAPHLIKNLISVRKFTTDNNVSIEFDPFGFCVKELETGRPLMRCKSTGDLYPLTSSATSSPFSFTALSPSLWHSRLGHPRNAILNSLRTTNLISCNKAPQIFCDSCPLGKHMNYLFMLLIQLL